MTFQIRGLPSAPFQHLFELDAAGLARHDARLCVADASPGFPCRVSLADAAPGEELLLLPFEHQAGPGPYRASGPIFIRRDAEEVALGAGVAPDMLRRRLLSLRAYDGANAIIGAEVVDGSEIERAIGRLLADDRTDYLHIHFAGRGCFVCRVDRAC